MSREHHHTLDAQGRAPQQSTTKHGKPLSELRTCTCNQGPDGTLLVDPDCPIHGPMHTGGRVTAPRPADKGATRTAV